MDQNYQPPVSSSPLPTPAEHHKIGPIVGVVIIIILLILAALYFWSQKLNNNGSTGTDNTSVYTQPTDTGTPVQAAAEEPAAPVRTAEEVKVDSELGLDGLNNLNDMDF